MWPIKHCISLIALLVAACALPSDPKTEAGAKQLAPTGRLRVGVVVESPASPLRAINDPATGRPRGVTVTLAAALAERLGVPLELVIYANPAALTASATSGAWDVTFITVDREREKVLDFGPAYFVFEDTYLVAPGSSIRSVAEVDRPALASLFWARAPRIGL